MNITHKDPFDRFMIAQAQAEGMALVSMKPCLTALRCSVSGRACGDFLFLQVTLAGAA
jgi:hypothetical protein